MGDVLSKSSKAIIAYAFAPISALIFLTTEKDDDLVRKSSAQSIVFLVFSAVLCCTLWMIPFVGWFMALVVWFGYWVLNILLMVKASHDIYYRIPIVSDISERIIFDFKK